VARYVGRQYYDNDQTNSFPDRMPAHATADLKLTHIVRDLSLSAAVNNLLDKHYYSYRHSQRGRHFVQRLSAAGSHVSRKRRIPILSAAAVCGRRRFSAILRGMHYGPADAIDVSGLRRALVISCATTATFF